MTHARKGTLLVVDDELLKRTTLEIELTAAGYRVLQAADPATALQYLEQEPVDVVVTDWRMPEMDGMQLLDCIKSRWPQTHVILMTAYGTVDSVVQAMKRGACDYVSKPFMTETLVVKLERLRSNGRGDGGVHEAAVGAVSEQGAGSEPAGSEGGADETETMCGISLKLPEAIAGVERSLINAALRRAAGNQAKAAQFLGIPRTTLRDKLAKYGLAAEPGQESN
jgi:DNA-binding NtrC family response regulator